MRNTGWARWQGCEFVCVCVLGSAIGFLVSIIFSFILNMLQWTREKDVWSGLKHRAHTAGDSAAAHLTVSTTQRRRQHLFELRGAGQLLQIETLQDLTVAAPSYSHYSFWQKFVNTFWKQRPNKKAHWSYISAGWILQYKFVKKKPWRLWGALAKVSEITKIKTSSF